MHINKNKINKIKDSSLFKKRVGFAMLSVLMLSSCGDTSLPPLFGGAGKKNVVQENTVFQPNAPVVATDTPSFPSNTANNKNMFANSLRTDNERLDRLERSVQSLRNDFDTVQPSIRRLMAIESDIQELIGELRDLSAEPSRMTSKNAPAPVVVETPVATPKARIAAPEKSSYQRKSAPPVEGGMATIFDIRSGEHPGKSRLVLDTNAAATYAVDIDNNENVMVVDLPNTKWTAATSKNFPKSSIISSYSVETSDTGNLLIIQLKKSAKIGYQAVLPSNSGSGKRIVIDVVAQ